MWLLTIVALFTLINIQQVCAAQDRRSFFSPLRSNERKRAAGPDGEGKNVLPLRTPVGVRSPRQDYRECSALVN